jgi:class 3 adenylate cyclase
VRVRRSFAFVDLSGFTSLTDARGDEPAVELLGTFRASCREVCSRRGVRIAKWLGDGAMLVCTETTPLVATVLELERHVSCSPLALRAGVTTGQVILFEGDDYIGHAVNLASRLCDLAQPHEVIALPEVAEFAPPWATARTMGAVAIRGLVREIDVVELSSREHAEGLFTDPVCRMELPADAVVDRRTGDDGVTVCFCSESCAETWDGRNDPARRGLLA